MPVRRLLLVALGAREARPLHEVGDGHRKVAIALAGPARRLQVLAALLRMPRQIFGRVAAHERKLQRPAPLPHDRRPDQLLLEKKADERRAPVEGTKEHEDVDPRDVIADDEIVPGRLRLLADAGDVPLCRQQPVEDVVVTRHPPLRQPGHGYDHARAQPAAWRRHLHGEFDDAAQRHRHAPPQEVAEEEDDDGDAAEHA